MKTIKIIIFLLLFCCPVFAADLYVATDGTDSGDCTAADCATINYAISQASNNDTIKVKAGSYDMNDESGDYVNVTGKTGLTITANDTENPPDFIGDTGEDYCFLISSEGTTLSYLIIKHKLARSGSGACIYVSAEDTLIDTCTTSYSGHGIFLDRRRNITVRDCISFNNGLVPSSPEHGNGHGVVLNTPNGTLAASWEEKVLIENLTAYGNGGDGFQCGNSNTSQYVELTGCSLYDNYEDGIDIKICTLYKIHNNNIYGNYGTGVGINSSYVQSNLEIYNNTIHGNGWTGFHIGSQSSNIRAWNNIIYNNARCLDGDCSDYGPSGDWDAYNSFGINNRSLSSELYGNVVHDNGTLTGTQSHGGINYHSGTYTTKNNSVFNNIGTNFEVEGTEDYNHVYPSPGGLGANSITNADPGFTDADNHDYTIDSDSALYNTGVALDAAYNTDILGISRPQFVSWDIGAYEFFRSTPATTSSISTANGSGNFR